MMLRMVLLRLVEAPSGHSKVLAFPVNDTRASGRFGAEEGVAATLRLDDRGSGLMQGDQ